MWNIGVNDVIKNSGLYAVTSTTCSTLLLCTDMLKLLFPPIDIQHTQCLPIRHTRDKSFVLIVTIFETDTYIESTTTRY